jgi:hypothetical protein
MIPLLAHRTHRPREDSSRAPGRLSTQRARADHGFLVTWRSLLVAILLGILAGAAFAAWERSTASTPGASGTRMTRILAI